MNNFNIRNVTSRDLETCYAIETRCFFPSEAASKAKIEKRIKVFPQGFLVAELGPNPYTSCFLNKKFRPGIKLSGPGLFGLGDTIVGHINSGATDQDDITDEAFKELIGHDSDGKNIVIFSLAVLPEFQKQGIAGQLLSSFIEQSKKLGKQKIMLICKSDLIAYYQKYGFVYVGESASTHGGFKWHEMFLVL